MQIRTTFIVIYDLIYCKKILIVTPFRSGTIHLGIVSCILSCIFEGDGITS